MTEVLEVLDSLHISALHCSILLFYSTDFSETQNIEDLVLLFKRNWLLIVLDGFLWDQEDNNAKDLILFFKEELTIDYWMLFELDVFRWDQEANNVRDLILLFESNRPDLLFLYHTKDFSILFFWLKFKDDSSNHKGLENGQKCKRRFLLWNPTILHCFKMDCRKEFRDIEKVYKYPKEEIKAHVIKCGGLHCSAIGQTCFSSALLPPAPSKHFWSHFCSNLSFWAGCTVESAGYGMLRTLLENWVIESASGVGLGLLGRPPHSWDRLMLSKRG